MTTLSIHLARVRSRFSNSRFNSRLALWSALLLLPLLTSCGGGGGGGNGPQAPPLDSATPVPDNSSSSCGQTFAPNYGASVTLLHWERFPLRVFFVQDAQFSTARQAIAVAGFNQWVAATGNRADYTIVTQASQAEISVSFFRFTGGSGDTLGTTTVSFTGDNVIRSAEIELGVTSNRSDDTLTAAHEFGHALGISGHSPNLTDLMYFSGNLSGDVTTRDLNTIRTAYCDDFNRSANRTSSAVGPLKTIVIH